MMLAGLEKNACSIDDSARMDMTPGKTGQSQVGRNKNVFRQEI
jgi:hypothetical protein